MPIEPILIVVAFFLFLIGIIVWAVRYGRRKNREKNEQYQTFALRLGLTYSERKHLFIKLPTLSGKYSNKDVEVYEKIQGAGKNQTVFTIIQLKNTPHNFQFRIGKEHFFSKIGKKMGFHDIEFDNHELDKKFLFKSKDEDQFRSLMNYKVIYELEGIESKFKGSLMHDNHTLTYTQLGVLTKPVQFDDLEDVLKFLVTLSEKSSY